MFYLIFSSLLFFTDTRTPRSRGSPTRCAQPATQVCLPCNDHAQPASAIRRPYKAPTSITHSQTVDMI